MMNAALEPRASHALNLSSALVALEWEVVDHSRDLERLLERIEAIQHQLHRLSGAATAATLHSEMLLVAAKRDQSTGVESEHGGGLKRALGQVRLISEELRMLARVTPGQAQSFVLPVQPLGAVLTELRAQWPAIEWTADQLSADLSFRWQGGTAGFGDWLKALLSDAAGRARSKVAVGCRFSPQRAQVVFEIRTDGRSAIPLVPPEEPASLRTYSSNGVRSRLYDCYRAVRMNGGQFFCDNSEEGGTVLRVHLPFAAPL